MNPPKCELVLFDFGGVLVDWDGVEPLVSISRNRLTKDEARRFWLESPSVREFERGRCSPDEFAESVIRELDIPEPPAAFLEAFLSWDKGFLDGATELLEWVSRFPVVIGCLSNNNALHWPRLRKTFHLDRWFSLYFVSHEIGMMKPDPDVFEYVRGRIPVTAERVLFLDDNPENVDAARKAGFQAERTRGVSEARSVLESYLGA